MKLLNLSYAFLGVECPAAVATAMFKATDTDNDGYITYVQYFQVIQKYVCKNADYKEANSDKVGLGGNTGNIPIGGNGVGLNNNNLNQGPERKMKIRAWIWSQIRKLYDLYIQGRVLKASDAELKGLIHSITGELKESEHLVLFNGLNALASKNIEFEPFVMIFLYLIAQIGLSRFSANHPNTKKAINFDEFVLILENTFEFIKFKNYKRSILEKIFQKIDKNHDGWITYEEYLDWIKRFLAVLKYYGDEFYVAEDDEAEKSDSFEKGVGPALASTTMAKFNFSDYTFANQVRARVLELLIPYDVDKNK